MIHVSEVFVCALSFFVSQLVRRWQMGSLHSRRPGGEALYGHHYPIRSLAAGQLETLVSADSSGEVAIWKV